jgi:hypothetical protein
MVMYNMDMNIPSKLASTVMPLIQEIKRNIVFRRYNRETTAYIPHYSTVPAKKIAPATKFLPVFERVVKENSGRY